MSHSAPNQSQNIGQDETDNVSIGGSDTDSDDEFNRLKKKRSEERIGR